jgi:CubicO group peptidase (beta-lactamase class C family)
MPCLKGPFALPLIAAAAIGSAGVAGSTMAIAAPVTPITARSVAETVDPIIEKSLAETGAPGSAFILVRDGRVVYSKGYGFADIAKREKVDPARTVWPIASITKTVTALAVLQLVDQRRVNLDSDVNRYLKRLKVPLQGFGPLTLRQLLSHTGGIDELPGRQFDGRTAPDMAAFLRTHIKRYRAPGRETAYSTYGIMLAALVLEDVTGVPYDRYVRAHIFAPAGMRSARFISRKGDERGVATPYRLKDGKAEPLPFEYYVSTPASSMVATVADMAKLLELHLGDGRIGNARILSPASMRLMHRQQATVHPALPGWSLGMQMERLNGVTIAEHGGDIGGFSALFDVLPERDVGFFIVSHGEGSNLRFKVQQALIDRFFPDPHPAQVPKPDPANAKALQEYAGRYLSSLACHTCPGSDEDAFTVEANADGTLSLWGQTWIPWKRDLFIRDDGKRLLGFQRDREGVPVAVTGGSWRVADRIKVPRN